MKISQAIVSQTINLPALLIADREFSPSELTKAAVPSSVGFALKPVYSLKLALLPHGKSDL